MKTPFLIVTVLSLLAAYSPLAAQDATPQEASPMAEARARGAFLDGGFYPQWSKWNGPAITADMEEAMRRARARMDGICAVECGQETWENVFEAYAEACYEMEYLDAVCMHLYLTNATPETIMAAGATSQTLNDFRSGNINGAKLYEVLKRAAAQPWVQELSPAKRRYVEIVLKQFRRAGAELPPMGRDTLQTLERKLGLWQGRFNANVREGNNEWQLVITDRSKLDGMPETWMAAAAADALKQGYGTAEQPEWVLTLAVPCVAEVMRSCTVEQTRKLVWQGWVGIGKDGARDNGQPLECILWHRNAIARLLGHRHYADMACEGRVLDSGDKALAFVDGMMQKTRPASERENQELLDFISQQKGEKVDFLNPWDSHFYKNLYNKEHQDFDNNGVRPYLRSDNVLHGMFAAFSRLYDISITELPSACPAAGAPCPDGTVEVWAPGVKVFKVTDNKTGAHLGSFYTDLTGRRGKKDGSWFCPLRLGRTGKDGQPREPHLAAVVCTLTPPTDKGYALYTPLDLETLFHEFGHALYILLSDVEVRPLATDRTGWDFVELPSRMNEHWAWEPEVIRLFAFHHETGEPMPEELLQKYISNRFIRCAGESMQQLGVAKLDLEMHIHYEDKFAGKPLDDVSDEILAPWLPAMSVSAPCIMRRTLHCITGGYQAGYYSYALGAALAADVFSRFKKEGVLNPATGAAFRETVIKPGEGRPAGERIREFLGREPDMDTLLKWQGILPPDNQPITKNTQS